MECGAICLARRKDASCADAPSSSPPPWPSPAGRAGPRPSGGHVPGHPESARRVPARGNRDRQAPVRLLRLPGRRRHPAGLPAYRKKLFALPRAGDARAGAEAGRPGPAVRGRRDRRGRPGARRDDREGAGVLPAADRRRRHQRRGADRRRRLVHRLGPPGALPAAARPRTANCPARRSGCRSPAR